MAVLVFLLSPFRAVASYCHFHAPKSPPKTGLSHLDTLTWQNLTPAEGLLGLAHWATRLGGSSHLSGLPNLSRFPQLHVNRPLGYSKTMFQKSSTSLSFNVIHCKKLKVGKIFSPTLLVHGQMLVSAAIRTLKLTFT